MQNIKEFIDLGLSQKSIEAIKAKGFETPTEIQKRCIPVLLSGHGDLIGQAQTGTGKTAAFSLPILEMLDGTPKKERTANPKALVLVPTRELCMQVCDEIQSLALGREVRTTAIYGGASYSVQLKALKTGADVVVGTPGRIQDHLERKTLCLDEIKVCVLDEADEMLDMGFIEDIENILSKAPEDRQMLCFSATMPEPILKLASKFMKDYELIRVQTHAMTSSLTKQIYYEVYENDKFEVLRRTIDMNPNFYGLVFCKTKLQCDEIGQRLITCGYNAEVLHGDLAQVQRELIVHKMREHRISILVATDVAARGIDIPELTHVINYSLPDEPESYIHRVGRTGRAGKEGLAVTFVTPREFNRFAFIKKIAKTEVEKHHVPGVEEIIAVKKQLLLDDLLKRIKDAENGECPDSMFSLAKLLSSEHHTTNIIAALLNDKYGRIVNLSGYTQIPDLYTHKETSERRLRSGLRRRINLGAHDDKKSRGRSKANVSRFKNLGKTKTR
ncbi:MAG: DEAD/DEAH box helicase [Sphaerochaeta sp.]